VTFFELSGSYPAERQSEANGPANLSFCGSKEKNTSNRRINIQLKGSPKKREIGQSFQLQTDQNQQTNKRALISILTFKFAILRNSYHPSFITRKLRTADVSLHPDVEGHEREDERLCNLLFIIWTRLSAY